MYYLYAYILVVRFKNLKCKYFNNFISSSKCRYIVKGKYDNGRLMSADEIEIVLTDVDFRFLLKAYSCEYEILESYSAMYGYLPKMLINFILDKYVKKTELKGVEDEEINYQRVKAMFNSIYGMTVTNTIRNDVLYDNIGGWSEKELTNEKIMVLENVTTKETRDSIIDANIKAIKKERKGERDIRIEIIPFCTVNKAISKSP